MAANRSISRTLSFFLTILLLLTGLLPGRSAAAAAPLPAGLEAGDWAQIQALLPGLEFQQAYLKASNTEAYDTFGKAVSISGDTLVVGAKDESSSASGVNGDEANNDLPGSGAAYVFIRTGSTWSQQAYLKASSPAANDRFGSAVAISGETLVVGAVGRDNQAGAIYVFTRSGTAWSQQAYLKGSNTEVDDFFGSPVAISGETLVVGTSMESSNATGVNGDGSNNLANGSGAAYVFIRTGTTWSQQAYIKASNTGENDYFGVSVSLSGDTLLVGAPWESSNASGVNGNQADNSLSNAGAAYVFTRTGTAWSQQAYLKASNPDANDWFGYSGSLAEETLVVGAIGEASNATGVNGTQTDNSLSNAGAAYVFTRSGTAWSQQAYLKASNPDANDYFGQAVALSGDMLVVGANDEDSNATGLDGNQADNSLSNAGAAYLFTRSGTAWSQKAYVKASNTGGSDNFGCAVSLSGNTLVVGALKEDSNATGVNGDGSNELATDSGAAYVFIYPPIYRNYMPLILR